MPVSSHSQALPRPWLILAAACLLQGCGDGKPWVDTSMTEATVSGTVAVKGIPATGGKILFNPSNAKRIVPTRIADIGPDGSYTIKTLTGIIVLASRERWPPRMLESDSSRNMPKWNPGKTTPISTSWEKGPRNSLTN